MEKQNKPNDAESTDVTRRQTLKRAGLTTAGAIASLGVAADSTRAIDVGAIGPEDIDLGGSDRYTGGWGPKTPIIDAKYSLAPSTIYDYAFKQIQPGLEYLGYSSDPDTTTTHWFSVSLASHMWKGNDRYHKGSALREQTGCRFVTRSPSRVDVKIKPAYQYAGFIDSSTVPRWEEVVNGTGSISEYKEEAQEQIPSGDGYSETLASVSATVLEEVLGTVGSPVSLAATVFSELSSGDCESESGQIGNKDTIELGEKWKWCYNDRDYPVPLQYLNTIVGFGLPYSSNSDAQASLEVGSFIRDRVNDNFPDSTYKRATAYEWDLNIPADEDEAQISDYQYK